MEAVLGCLWSWALAAAPAAFTWQDGRSRASSSDSCSLCCGNAVSLCLWACHLTVFNGLSPFPQTEAMAGQSRLPLALFSTEQEESHPP